MVDYIFNDQELKEVTDTVKEEERIIESEGKHFRLTLTKEELPKTFLLDLLAEENDKLKVLEEEANKIKDERNNIIINISSNVDLYKGIEIPVYEVFGKDINEELRILINGEEEIEGDGFNEQTAQ